MLLLVGALAIGLMLGAALTYARPAAATDAALDRWQAFIAEASRRFGMPEVWIRAVMRAERGGRRILDGRPITAPAGAIGLMQVRTGDQEEKRRVPGRDVGRADVMEGRCMVG